MSTKKLGTVDDELLTVDDVAALLKVPKRWVYERAQRGEIASGKVGRYLRFRRGNVQLYVNSLFPAALER